MSNPARYAGVDTSSVREVEIKARACLLVAVAALTATTTLIPASAGAPDHLLCSPGANGGHLVKGVCVLPAANVGQQYEGFIITSNESGGTFSISAGTLPPGTSMPSRYGAAGTIVAGTPTIEGSFKFTVKGIDDQGQPLQQTYRIKVRPPLPLVITSGPCCPGGKVHVAYSVNLFSDGGAPPVGWSVTSGSLPQGITLTPTPPARLSGVPTTSGTFTFTLDVTDSRGTHATQTATLTVKP